MISKPTRISDEDILDFYRKRRCDICGKRPTDACHIRTKGAGGHDEHNNLMSLCREHHTEQHQIGFYKMVQKYPFFGQFLAQKNWIFDGNKKLRRE